MLTRHVHFIISNANLCNQYTTCINNDTSLSGNDVHLIRKILDPKYLDRAEDTYRDMQLTIQRHGTWASAWVSESGGVFNNDGLLCQIHSSTASGQFSPFFTRDMSNSDAGVEYVV